MLANQVKLHPSNKHLCLGSASSLLIIFEMAAVWECLHCYCFHVPEQKKCCVNWIKAWWIWQSWCHRNSGVSHPGHKWGKGDSRSSTATTATWWRGVRTKLWIGLNALGLLYTRSWQIMPQASCIMLCWQFLDMLSLCFQSKLYYAHIMLNYVLGFSLWPKLGQSLFCKLNMADYGYMQL